MKLKSVYLILTLCLVLPACQEEEEPSVTNQPDDDQKTDVIQQIDKTAAAGVADEVIQHWKLGSISEENYLQVTEDWDSVWHVYYTYRYSEEEEVSPKAIPHLLIPKKEKVSIRVFVTH